MTSLRQQIFAIILICSLVLILSYPGTSGDFWFDDKTNIVSNSTLHIDDLSLNSLWKAAWSGPATKIGRPISMLSFALNSYFSQLTPFFYKLSNILLHIANAILIFYLSWRLLLLSVFKEKLHLEKNEPYYLAIGIALVWAITPINIASSLYIVQRMNELSAFFTLLGLLLYLHVRTSKQLSVTKQVLFFCLYSFILILAILSKENGALLPALTLTIEIILWNKKANAAKNYYFIRLILLLLIVAPGILALFWLSTHYGKIIEEYELRSFSLQERLLSEPRILFIYIQQTLFPEVYKLSLYHDDFVISKNFFTPYTTLISILSLLFASIYVFFIRKVYPWLFLGVIWFLVSHSLESSILPLELIFEHRNYLPSFGIIFLAILSLFHLSKKYAKERLLYPVLSIYIFTLGVNSYIAASVRGNTTLMLKTFVEEHPTSARSHYAWALLNEELYSLDSSTPKYLQNSIKHAAIATQLDQDLINGLLFSFLLKRVHDIPDREDLNLLLSRLSSIRPHVSNTRVLKKLFTVNLQKPELFNDSATQDLVQAYLSNPLLKGRLKAIFLKDYAQYLIDSGTMNMETLDLLTAANNEFPQNIELKFFLIQGLINLHQYRAVELLLPVVQEMDKLKRFQQEINLIKKILDEHSIQ